MHSFFQTRNRELLALLASFQIKSLYHHPPVLSSWNACMCLQQQSHNLWGFDGYQDVACREDSAVVPVVVVGDDDDEASPPKRQFCLFRETISSTEPLTRPLAGKPKPCLGDTLMTVTLAKTATLHNHKVQFPIQYLR